MATNHIHNIKWPMQVSSLIIVGCVGPNEIHSMTIEVAPGYKHEYDGKTVRKDKTIIYQEDFNEEGKWTYEDSINQTKITLILTADVNEPFVLKQSYWVQPKNKDKDKSKESKGKESKGKENKSKDKSKDKGKDSKGIKDENSNMIALILTNDIPIESELDLALYDPSFPSESTNKINHLACGEYLYTSGDLKLVIYVVKGNNETKVTVTESTDKLSAILKSQKVTDLSSCDQKTLLKISECENIQDVLSLDISDKSILRDINKDVTRCILNSLPVDNKAKETLWKWYEVDYDYFIHSIQKSMAQDKIDHTLLQRLLSSRLKEDAVVRDKLIRKK